MSLKFKRVSVHTMRDSCTIGVVDDLEYGLLKKSAKTLNWKTEEKSTLLELRIDTLVVQAGPKEVEVRVKSLCHSRAVTVDYLNFQERFNMKPCILVMGSYGEIRAPWAQLIHPAMFLYLAGCNVIFVEIPQYDTDGLRWVQYGPSLIAGALKFMSIEKVSVCATGNGGGVFLATVTRHPEVFAKTHFVYNCNLPKMKKHPFDLPEMEELLRTRNTQFWFAFNDEDDVYERFAGDTMPGKCYDAVAKVQASLSGERARGRRYLPYDEVLITETINQPKNIRVRREKFGLNPVLIFSDELCDSLTKFFALEPSALQDDLVGVGLIGEKVGVAHAQIRAKKMPELKALAKLETHNSEQRIMAAEANRRRLDRFNSAIKDLLPAQPRLPRLEMGARSLQSPLALSQGHSHASSAPNLSTVGNSPGRAAITDGNPGALELEDATRGPLEKSTAQAAPQDGRATSAPLALQSSYNADLQRLQGLGFTDLRRNITILQTINKGMSTGFEGMDDDAFEEVAEGLDGFEFLFDSDRESESDTNSQESPRKADRELDRKKVAKTASDESKMVKSHDYQKTWAALRGRRRSNWIKNKAAPETDGD